MPPDLQIKMNRPSQDWCFVVHRVGKPAFFALQEVLL